MLERGANKEPITQEHLRDSFAFISLLASKLAVKTLRIQRIAGTDASPSKLTQAEQHYM